MLINEIEVPETLNGKPTRNSLNRLIHPSTEGILNFWKWFGQSTIVDDHGRPLVLMHGSGADFDVFIKPKVGKNSGHLLDIGFHFGSEAAANEYANLALPDFHKFRKDMSRDAKEGTPTVYAVYLKIESVLDLTKNFPPDFLKELLNLAEQYGMSKRSKYVYLADVGGENRTDLLTILQKKSGRKQIRDFIIRAGYDGIKYPFHGESYVVFNSNQIKSATGNNGAFSSKDSIISERTK